MDHQAPDAAIARAINRVLAAERDAAEFIAAAQRDAETVIEAARSERRRLLERARARAARLHAAARERTERELRALDAGASASRQDLETLDRFTREAVTRLARRLTATGHESR